jgi:hypothetical protein
LLASDTAVEPSLKEPCDLVPGAGQAAMAGTPCGACINISKVTYDMFAMLNVIVITVRQMLRLGDVAVQPLVDGLGNVSFNDFASPVSPAVPQRPRANEPNPHSA